MPFGTFAHVKQLGIISDIHGLVRPELYPEAAGVDLIIHAGDIGKPVVLDELSRIAPVIAVRGNVDRGTWADKLHRTEVVEVDDQLLLYVIHNIEQIDLDPKAAGFAAVIYGHGHKPSIEEKNEVYYLNPGSIGPRRFSLPVAFIRAEITRGRIVPKIVRLK